MATKKWIPIVVGIVIFIVVVGAGLLAGLVYVFTRQVNVQAMTAEAGSAEFDRLVATMAGQTPFIEMPSDDEESQPVVHRELETKDTGTVSTLRVRIWTPSDRKLVRVDLPFWVLRLGGNRPLRINAGAHRDVTLKVTPEEIERRGPGLILSHKTRGGERLLVWTE